MVYYSRKLGKSQISLTRIERIHAMKQKVGKAVQLVLAVTMEDIGFFLICGIALAVILKLASA